MDLPKILFDILKAEVCEENIGAYTLQDDEIDTLLSLAYDHDISYCVIDGLLKSKCVTENSSFFKSCQNEINKAMVRSVRFNSTISLAKSLFNKAQIPFMPLKGAIIKKLYPGELMRSSCDIDILIKEEYFDRAIDLLSQNGFIRSDEKKHHDVSMYYGKTNLELHFSLIERMDDIDTLLNKVWDYAVPVSEYEYTQTHEYFVFHHIAHMKFHFVGGGCGIKPFLDLFIMRRHNFYEEEKLYELLDMAGLRKFYGSILQVISVWFEGAPHNELTLQCQKYILRGGVYGTVENQMAVQSSIKGSRFKNLMRAVFPQSEIMYSLYPILKNHKILFPFCYLHRIFKKTFGKGSKTSRSRAGRILKQESYKINSVKELFDAVGLDEK
ncbi:MAG: nucleotidyltransferase family protein [Oscillospiraceae bacterium]|nr:nucleotidyltransferase family protein [Candidatus Equicaccousia limihippi]